MNRQRFQPHQRWITPLLSILLLALCTNLVLFIGKNATSQSYGFVSYYTASRLLLEGAPVERFYDTAWFAGQVRRYTPDRHEIYLLNPPTTSLMLLPVASLDYATARVCWLVFSLVLFAAAVAGTIHVLKLKHLHVLLVLILLLVYHPLYVNIRFAQAYMLLSALSVVAWLGLRSRRHPITGSAMGVMLGLKSIGLPFWPLPVVRGQWRSVVWGMAVAAMLLLVSLPFIGIEAWSRYLLELRGLSTHSEIAVTAYQSLPGFLQHLFVYDARWNTAPLLDLPAVASWVNGSVVVAMLVATYWWSSRRNATIDLAFAAVMILTVIISPFSLDYHYLLLFVPIVILLQQAFVTNSLFWRIAVVGAIAMLALPLPYHSPRLAGGALAFLAYPKLYAGLLLWLAALRIPGADPATSSPPLPSRTTP